MADYRRMYLLLCKAVDEAITMLEQTPQAGPVAQHLKRALLQAEEIYIATCENDIPQGGSHR